MEKRLTGDFGHLHSLAKLHIIVQNSTQPHPGRIYATQKTTLPTILYHVIVASSIICLFHVCATCPTSTSTPQTTATETAVPTKTPDYVHAKADLHTEPGCRTADE